MEKERRYGGQKRQEGDDPRRLLWRGQEVPFDHPDSRWRFDPIARQTVATRTSLAQFTVFEIAGVLDLLREQAEIHDGLDYLQTFEDAAGRRLWVIENEEAITALLPEDY